MVRDRWRWRGSRHVRHPCPGQAAAAWRRCSVMTFCSCVADAHSATYGCSLSENDVAAGTPLRIHLAQNMKHKIIDN
jgi:hypothetical protein